MNVRIVAMVYATAYGQTFHARPTQNIVFIPTGDILDHIEERRRRWPNYWAVHVSTAPRHLSEMLRYASTPTEDEQ